MNLDDHPLAKNPPPNLLRKPAANMQVVDLHVKETNDEQNIEIKEEPATLSAISNGNGGALDNGTNANLFNIKDTYIMTKEQSDL